ncbi:MAG TPA: hydroxylamine reductase, partial [Spirochaetales bacterium]|nr:hydroxylamine reductase [Spirochaetales bacterium]
MFCYQCQEAMGNKGCSLAKGVCGKDAATSEMQDLLIHTLKGVAAWANEARAHGLTTTDADNAV